MAWLPGVALGWLAFGFRSLERYVAAIYHCCVRLPLPTERDYTFGRAVAFICILQVGTLLFKMNVVRRLHWASGNSDGVKPGVPRRRSSRISPEPTSRVESQDKGFAGDIPFEFSTGF